MKQQTKDEVTRELEFWRRELIVHQADGDAEDLELDRRILDYLLDQRLAQKPQSAAEKKSLLHLALKALSRLFEHEGKSSNLNPSRAGGR